MPPRASSQAADGDVPSSSGRVSAMHKMAFIQALMARNTMTEADAKKLLAEICGASYSDAAYMDAISQANQDMAFAGLQLKTMKSPVDDERYLGLINKEADDASKLGTRYSVQQREYFRAVIETLARTYPGPVASAPLATLLNLEVTVTSRSGGAAGDNSPGAPSQSQSQAAAPSQSQPAFAVGSQAPGAAARTVAPKQLSKKDRESTLRDFWLDGWLAHAPSKPNHFCIGVRTLMELGDFLLNLEGLPEETRAMLEGLL